MTITASPMTVPRIGPGRLGQVPVWELDAPRVQRLRLGDARYPGAPYYGSYGAYLIQAGLGRAVVRHGGGVAYQAPRVVPWGLRGYARLGGYPRGLGRVGPRRLGQSWWEDFSTIFGPVPGGGSVTTHAGTTCVDSNGNAIAGNADGSCPSLPSWAGYTATGLASAATSGLASDIPWWVYLLGAGAIALYLGAGKGLLKR